MHVSRSILASSIILLLAALGLAACASGLPSAPPTAAATTAPTSAPTTAAPTTAPTAAATTAAPTTSATTAPTTAAGGASGGGAAAMPELKVARVAGFGLFLTDAANRTLYAFTKDAKNTSNCTGTCAQTWPPYAPQGTLQAQQYLNLTLVGEITRLDGTKQVTYNGQPLYYFSGDKNPGDIKGQGVATFWHVLSPRGNPMLNAAPAATASPTP